MKKHFDQNISSAQMQMYFVIENSSFDIISCWFPYTVLACALDSKINTGPEQAYIRDHQANL